MWPLPPPPPCCSATKTIQGFIQLQLLNPKSLPRSPCAQGAMVLFRCPWLFHGFF